MFFWFDRWLFSRYRMDGEWWEVGEDKVCHDCNKHIKVGFRLIRAEAYDRIEHSTPEFRCRQCRDKKYLMDGRPYPPPFERIHEEEN